MEPIIQIENIHKHFGRVYALRGVSLDVAKGEVVVIVGPSGSGKSTLLRCINRLEEYDEDELWWMVSLLTQQKILTQSAAKWVWSFNRSICLPILR